jgi:hypothetical protein
MCLTCHACEPGLGGALAECLCRSGFGHIVVVDDGDVTESDCNGLFYQPQAIGWKRVSTYLLHAVVCGFSVSGNTYRRADRLFDFCACFSCLRHSIPLDGQSGRFKFASVMGSRQPTRTSVA